MSVERIKQHLTYICGYAVWSSAKSYYKITKYTVAEVSTATFREEKHGAFKYTTLEYVNAETVVFDRDWELPDDAVVLFRGLFSGKRVRIILDKPIGVNQVNCITIDE